MCPFRHTRSGVRVSPVGLLLDRAALAHGPLGPGHREGLGLVGRDHPQGGGHRLAVPALGVTRAGDHGPVQLRAGRVPGLGRSRSREPGPADAPAGWAAGRLPVRPDPARRSRTPCTASRRGWSERAWRTAGRLPDCPERGEPTGPRCGSGPARWGYRWCSRQVRSEVDRSRLPTRSGSPRRSGCRSGRGTAGRRPGGGRRRARGRRDVRDPVERGLEGAATHAQHRHQDRGGAHRRPRHDRTLDTPASVAALSRRVNGGGNRRPPGRTRLRGRAGSVHAAVDDDVDDGEE